MNRRCVLVALGLLTPCWVKAENLFSPAGWVKSFVGLGHVERQNQRLPASVGLALQRGDRLIAGQPGGLGVTLIDDTTLTVGADSQVELVEVRFSASTREGRLHIRLIKGALHVSTGLIARSAPQNVRIETPAGVMGIRGTAFIVEGRGQP